MAKRTIGLKCPGCKRVIKEKGFETTAVCRGEVWWHRRCHFKTTEEYATILQLFNMQDDADIASESETALADLIANIGHFANINNINFIAALEKGRKYWLEEK